MSLNYDRQRACIYAPDDIWVWKFNRMILTWENRRTRRKTCRSATFSTTNTTWTDPDANPDLCGESPAINHLSHCRYQFQHCNKELCSRYRSVSIVSGYGLDNRTIEVRSPAEVRDFSSNLCVQTGSEAHPASCTMDTGGGFFPRG
jgi:hypothetical protein